MRSKKQNWLDGLRPTQSMRLKPLWLVGLVVFVGIGSGLYGGIHWVQNQYFEGSRVLGEADDGGMRHETDIQSLNKIFGIAAVGIKAAPYVEFVSQLLGDTNTVKTYLIVFQNNSEIRPTGGFMGSYAWVRIVGGKQVSYGVPGGGFYDLTGSRSVLVESPKPFQVFSPMEQIWNANWHPDFAESAKRVSWLYVNSGQDSVDGIITISPELLERLLELTGPIELLEFQKTITAENAYRELQFHVEFEYDKAKNKPKEILSILIPKLLDRLAALPPSEYPKVIRMISDLLDHKQIVAYMTDPEAQAFVQSRGWDGRMLAYEQANQQNVGNDYLMVVHTNVGGGKTDFVVRTKESVEKTILPDGTIRTVVTIIRSHQGDPADPLEGLTNIDYVRIYAPEGAGYVSSEGFGELPKELYKDFEPRADGETREEVAIERDALVIESDHTRVVREVYPEIVNVPERRYTSFGNWMIVKPGESVIARMTFDVPSLLPNAEAGAKQPLRRLWNTLLFKNNQPVYSLLWQKQPGMDEVDQMLLFSTPNGIDIYTSEVTPSLENNRELVWDAISSQDHVFVVGLQ